MNQPVVYVVQEPTRWNHAARMMERTIDISPAAVYGRLEILLPPGKVMLSTQPMVQELRKKLKDFSDRDHLLAVGDPSAIAAAAMVAAMYNHGRIKMLKWHRETQAYISVQVDVTGRAAA